LPKLRRNKFKAGKFFGLELNDDIKVSDNSGEKMFNRSVFVFWVPPFAVLMTLETQL